MRGERRDGGQDHTSRRVNSRAAARAMRPCQCRRRASSRWRSVAAVTVVRRNPNYPAMLAGILVLVRTPDGTVSGGRRPPARRAAARQAANLFPNPKCPRRPSHRPAPASLRYSTEHTQSSRGSGAAVMHGDRIIAGCPCRAGLRRPGCSGPSGHQA
jgi:hypothetical protein